MSKMVSRIRSQGLYWNDYGSANWLFYMKPCEEGKCQESMLLRCVCAAVWESNYKCAKHDFYLREKKAKKEVNRNHEIYCSLEKLRPCSSFHFQ